MDNKGFTLIELIGTIVILAIISLIAFPEIINSIKTNDKKLKDSVKEIVVSAASEYVNDHISDFPKKLGEENGIKRTYSTNISYQLLESEGYLDITLGEKHCEILDDQVIVTSNTKKYFFEYQVNDADSGC